MARSRKKERQSKAKEKERIERLHHPERFDDNGIRIVKSKNKKHQQEPSKYSTDSNGNYIPTEQERKENEQSSLQVKDALGDKKKERQQTYRSFNSQKKPKIKTKYVLTNDAKKAIYKVAAIAVAAVLCVIALITVFNNDNNNDGSISDIEEEKAISLAGMSDKGRKLIDSFDKYDNFWKNKDKISYSNIYDTVITVEDANILSELGQYPHEDGIFAYNENISTKVKQAAGKN